MPIIVRLSNGTAVDVRVTIPPGLEASVTVLLHGSVSITTSSSDFIPLRAQGDVQSLGGLDLICTCIASNLIHLGHGKTVIIEVLENGTPVKEILLKYEPDDLVVTKAVTFLLVQV